jgi:hypothetical protein
MVMRSATRFIFFFLFLGSITSLKAQFESLHLWEADLLEESEQYEKAYYDLQGTVKTVDQRLYHFQKQHWWSLKKKKQELVNSLVAKTFTLNYLQNGYLSQSVTAEYDVDYQINGGQHVQEVVKYKYNINHQLTAVQINRKNAFRYDSLFYTVDGSSSRVVSYDFYGDLASEIIFTYDQENRIATCEKKFYHQSLDDEVFTYQDSTYTVITKKHFPSGEVALGKRVHQLNGQRLYYKTTYPKGPTTEIIWERNRDGLVKRYQRKEWSQDSVLTENGLKEYEYNEDGQLTLISIYGHWEDARKQYLSSKLNRQYDDQGRMTQEVSVDLNRSGEEYRGVQKDFSYDDQGRLSSVLISSFGHIGGSGTNEWQFTYDEQGNWISKNILINGELSYIVERVITYYSE